MFITNLREIKKDVVKNGGTFKREKFLLNNNICYRVNGKLYTKTLLIVTFNQGGL